MAVPLEDETVDVTGDAVGIVRQGHRGSSHYVHARADSISFQDFSDVGEGRDQTVPVH